MRLLIMGPPGAGKGTQAKLIAHRYRIPSISTGDIFRSLQHQDTALAQQVRQIMAAGGYVGDDITNQIVAQRLEQDDCRPGFLLDGYPRTVQQAKTLERHQQLAGNRIDAVLALTARSDAIVARLLKRAELEGRADDNEETIAKRQQVYLEQTAPLLETYRDQNLLIEVDGLGEISEVFERLVEQLRVRLASAADPSSP